MRHLIGAALMTALIITFIGPALAGPEDDARKHRDALNTATKSHVNAERSQQRINRSEAKSQTLREQFLTTTLQTEKLKVYTKQLETLLSKQDDKKAEIARQMEEVQEVERDVLPLLQEMIDTLADFVSLDLPFKADERVERIENLRQTLNDPEQAVATKYRKVLEAWQKEIDYGETIGAWRQELLLGVDSRTVDFLHIGRLGLFYQTLDGKESGQWNPKHQRWEPLSGAYSPAIRRGIRMAREQAAPNLLELPMPAPEMAGGAS